MTAAEHGHPEIVEMLLKAGANVSIIASEAKRRLSLQRKP
jgi:hypothetical protein